MYYVLGRTKRRRILQIFAIKLQVNICRFGPLSFASDFRILILSNFPVVCLYGCEIYLIFPSLIRQYVFPAIGLLEPFISHISLLEKIHEYNCREFFMNFAANRKETYAASITQRICWDGSQIHKKEQEIRLFFGEN